MGLSVLVNRFEEVERKNAPLDSVWSQLGHSIANGNLEDV